MRKIYNIISKFLSNHYKLNVFLMASLTIVSGIILIQIELKLIIGISFVSSLYSAVRLITFAKGNIPFFMIDKHWNCLELKHGKDKAEEIYKKESLRNSSIAYIIALISFLIGISIEILIAFHVFD